ncbi:Toxin ParE1 [bacterium YEK0313]|nr:Toxin ParE1 [bacterium YEK0313]
MVAYRLSRAALGDIVDILSWTHARFGEQARLRYERLLVAALRDIASDPMRVGSVGRPDLGRNVRSYHLRHGRGRVQPANVVVHSPRHLLLYRVAPGGPVGIGRVLHDAMEIERHIPTDYG